MTSELSDLASINLSRVLSERPDFISLEKRTPSYICVKYEEHVTCLVTCYQIGWYFKHKLHRDSDDKPASISIRTDGSECHGYYHHGSLLKTLRHHA
jgi:hypothetical protein